MVHIFLLEIIIIIIKKIIRVEIKYMKKEKTYVIELQVNGGVE
jgi:hypothetical protein